MLHRKIQNILIKIQILAKTGKNSLPYQGINIGQTMEYKPAKCGSWINAKRQSDAKFQTYVNHAAFKTNSELHLIICTIFH